MPRLPKIWSLVLTVLAMGMLPQSAAGTFGVRWDPVQGASGYRVYYGTSPGNYTASLDVGNVLSATLPNLGNCQDYSVAVKAYNGAGEGAQFSNEVTGWPRPQIDTFDRVGDQQSPGFGVDAQQGDLFTLNINGANFDPAVSIQMSSNIPEDIQQNPLLRVESFSVLSCTQIQATVAVEPGAAGLRAMEVGDFDIDFEATNPDNVFGTRVGAFSVVFEESRADINSSDGSTRDRVDGQDLVWFAQAHGTIEGDPRYNPDADLDGDGWVDGQDLVYIATRFGLCWSGLTWNGGACP